jgi:hypothetical protein
MRTNSAQAEPVTAEVEAEQWLEVVKKHVASLSFGVVQITVHDSRVVQIEKTERTRFQPSKTASNGSRHSATV